MKRTAQVQMQKPAPTKKPMKKRASNPANPPRRLGAKIEKKNYDVFAIITPPLILSQWTAPVSLFLPIIGGQPDHRIGRKTTCTKLILRYKSSSTASPKAVSQWRIFVIYDKQSNAGLPNILQPLVTNNPISPNNLQNGERFITLMDILTEMPGAGQLVTTGVQVRKINLDTLFNDDNNGAYSDITTGSFILYAVSLNAVSTDTLDIYTRLRFVDQ